MRQGQKGLVVPKALKAKLVPRGQRVPLDLKARKAAREGLAAQVALERKAKPDPLGLPALKAKQERLARKVKQVQPGRLEQREAQAEPGARGLLAQLDLLVHRVRLAATHSRSPSMNRQEKQTLEKERLRSTTPNRLKSQRFL